MELDVEGTRELYDVLYWPRPGLEVDGVLVRVTFDARLPGVPRLDSTNSSSNLLRLIERELLQNKKKFIYNIDKKHEKKVSMYEDYEYRENRDGKTVSYFDGLFMFTCSNRLSIFIQWLSTEWTILMHNMKATNFVEDYMADT